MKSSVWHFAAIVVQFLGTHAHTDSTTCDALSMSDLRDDGGRLQFERVHCKGPHCEHINLQSATCFYKDSQFECVFCPKLDASPDSYKIRCRKEQFDQQCFSKPCNLTLDTAKIPRPYLGGEGSTRGVIGGAIAIVIVLAILAMILVGQRRRFSNHALLAHHQLQTSESDASLSTGKSTTPKDSTDNGDSAFIRHGSSVYV